MIYEYRCYDVVAGYLPELHRGLAEDSLPLFEKHGIHPIGFWETVVGDSNQLHYIVPFADLADMEARWRTFRSDPTKGPAQTTPDGQRVTMRVTNQIWRPTSYSKLK